MRSKIEGAQEGIQLEPALHDSSNIALSQTRLLWGRQRSRLGFGSFALVGVDGPQPKANHQEDPCNQAGKNLTHPWVGDDGRIFEAWCRSRSLVVYPAPARMQPYP